MIVDVRCGENTGGSTKYGKIRNKVECRNFIVVKIEKLFM